MAKPKVPVKPTREPKPTEKKVYCIHCGEQLPAHATFCRKCGKKIE